MRHPSTRAERRAARSRAQNRRRKRLFLIHLRDHAHEQNRAWNKGGKQSFACGNRCAHRLIERHEHRQALKRLRRSN